MEERDWTAEHVVVVSEGNERDLGAILKSALRETPLTTVRLQLACKEIDWEEAVTIPFGRRVFIDGQPYIHSYIAEKNDPKGAAEEDSARCPNRIRMRKNFLVYPNADESHGYYGAILYHRAELEGSASLHFRGLTFIEETASPLREMSTNRVYCEGVVRISGSFSHVEITDSRIEMTRFAFVSGHAAGISHVNLGHVRFVGLPNNGTPIHPVVSTRGQSWSGHECAVSVTDVVLDDAVSWSGECHDPPFKLRYLSM